MNIQDLITGSIGSQLAGGLSQKLGLEQSKVSSVVSMAVPFLLGQINKNAQTPQGAESLNKALDNHSGSVLDNIGSVISGNNSDGLGILGHVFGGNHDKVAEGISAKTGVPSSGVTQILANVAPVVMGFLGKQKSEGNVGSNGISGLLSSVLGGAAGGGLNLDTLKGFLDQDGDGNISDDVMDMGSKLLKGLF